MKNRQNHSRATAGFVTLSGLLLGLILADQYQPAVALAGDDKVFAPHSCVALEPGTDRKSFHSEFWREWVSGHKLICPLVRDLVKGELDAVWVRVSDYSDNLDDATECCVHSVSPLGFDSDFECEKADITKDSQSIEFDLDGFEEYDNGHYVVTCDMHGDLYSIRTRESD